MKVTKCIDITKLVNSNGFNSKKIVFIRVDSTPVDESLGLIYNIIADKCWINRKYDRDIIRKSIESRVDKTINNLKVKLLNGDSDSITSEAGELLVSVLGKKALTDSLKYIDIPLAELWKEKVVGNPGFDYHAESSNNKIIFGEAKYLANTSAYNKALTQICSFIDKNKDLDEVKDLEAFVTDLALDNFQNGNKGYSASFSSTSIETEKLLTNILINESFKKLLVYDEVILVAVDING